MVLVPRLRGRIGRGMPNEPGDVLAGKRLMALVGGLAPPSGGFGAGFDRPLEGAITGYQADRRLLVDGVMGPGGETERNIRRDLGLLPKEPPLSLTELDLEGAVGNGAENRARDLKAVLGRLGLFDFDRTAAPPAYITKDLDQAIQTFQRDNDLLRDGLIEPGGETISALKDAVAKQTDEGKRPENDDKEDPKRPGNPKKPENPDNPEKSPESRCSDLLAELFAINNELNRVVPLITKKETALRHAKDTLVAVEKDRPFYVPMFNRSGRRKKPNLTEELISVLTETIGAKGTSNRSELWAEKTARLRRELAELEKELERLREEERELIGQREVRVREREALGCGKRDDDDKD